MERIAMLKNLVITAAGVPVVHQFVTRNHVGRQIASRFVAGETLDDAMRVAQELNSKGIAASLDFLGENTTSVAEAAATAANYVAILDRIASADARANISIKLTALGLDLGEEICLRNVRAVLDRACAHGLFVRLDMEGSAYTDATLRLTHQLHAEYVSKTMESGGCVGTVIQSMLYRSADDLAFLIERGIRVRLVKGAYREPSSIAFPQKFDVDEHYRQLMYTLLQHGIYPAIATHDEHLIADAQAFAHDHHISSDRFEFQLLYGIRRDLQEKLIAEGYRVRIYVPYGTHWYPYLTRRMAERPANLFFVLNSAVRG
jgi:proline dehydrogenase